MFEVVKSPLRSLNPSVILAAQDQVFSDGRCVWLVGCLVELLSVYSTNMLPKPLESAVLIHLQAEAELPFRGQLAPFPHLTASCCTQLPLTH